MGSSIWRTWREFESWEKWRPAEVEQRSEALLGQTLGHAIANVEHYRKLGLASFSNEPSTALLKRFPVLTRAAVREHFNRLVVDSKRPQITSPMSVAHKRYDWLVVKTGGTTGHPTSVVHDAEGRDWGRATRLYAAKLSGFPLGVPYFRLWGSEPDLLNQQASLQLRVLRALNAEVPLNAFKMKEADLRSHHATLLCHSEIHHMMAYVDAAAGLAHFIKERNLPRLRLRSLQACAGTVTKEFRSLVEESFQTEVFDKYGSRDCADMACECSEHKGLHVFSQNVFLEVVNEDNQDCPPGQVGRILVTQLHNPTFPLIRYEIGDVGSWAEPVSCPCGLPFRRLAELHGRQDDMLMTVDGTWQSSAFVRHFVGVSLNRQLIREWQLEQTDLHRFVFRYIPAGQEGLMENLERIAHSFQLVFGKGVKTDFVQVSEIPQTATGKVRWIINSYRKMGGASP